MTKYGQKFRKIKKNGGQNQLHEKKCISKGKNLFSISSIDLCFKNGKFFIQKIKII